MNRFLSKKKPDEAAGGGRWKKGKKPHDDPKPEPELAIALPSNDDFRTSLLMADLSARFSMLRDQDNPNTKIGKASDDSVLQPKRQSRLPDFGFSKERNLNDIAEVASVSSSVRPPWLTNQHDSFVSDESEGADGESSRNGSIMNRARPLEGNVLFGGRQKIYKIPNSKSTKSLGGDNAMGRAIYDDDVSQSAFQKFKQAEKERLERQALPQVDHNNPHYTPLDPPSASSSSNFGTLPAHAYSSNATDDRLLADAPRQASIDSISPSEHAHDAHSTPATSIASQTLSSPLASSFLSKSKINVAPLERSMTKRRLYEQTLDQSRQEQQVSALTRLNSIQRNISGTKSPPMSLTQKTSTASLHQQDRSINPYAPRPQSPTEVLTTFESISKLNPPSASPASSRPQTPTFLPLNHYDDMNPLSSTVQPSDRGKATAMGAFQMPQHSFDEDQYLERLQRLQNGTSSPEAAVSPLESEPPVSVQLARFDSARQRPKQDNSISPPASRARSQSQPNQPDPPNAFSVFQRAAAQMRSDHSYDTFDTDRKDPEERVPDTHRTFFGDISASDDDDDDILSDYGRGGYHGASAARFRPGELENIQEHPSARTPTPVFPQIREEDEDYQHDDVVAPPQPLRQAASRPSLADSAKDHVEPVKEEEPPILQAETYQPAPGNALGGLIHQHLRNTSNVSSAPSLAPRDPNHFRQSSDHSSIYPSTAAQESSAAKPSDTVSKFQNRTYTSVHRMDSTYTDSNPWDLDDFDNSYYYNNADSKNSRLPSSTREKPEQPVKQPLKVTTDELRNDMDMESPDWRPDHKRELSAGTLQHMEEQAAFERDVATRRAAIQENLKSIVEVQTHSRGSSPQPTQAGSFKAFNMLKNKSSRDSFGKSDSASKAQKLLGIGITGPASTSLPGSRKASAVNEDISGRAASDRFPSYANSPRPSVWQRTPPMGTPKTNDVCDMQRSRGDSEASLSKSSFNRSSPPGTSAGLQSRARSNSHAPSARNLPRSDRFATENGRSHYESSAVEGVPRPGISPLQGPNISPDFPNGSPSSISPHFPPRPSPGIQQRPMGPPDIGRMRNGSRSAAPSPVEPPMSAAPAATSTTSLVQTVSNPQASMPPQPSPIYRTVPSTSASAPPSATFRPGNMSIPSPRPSPMPSPYYANPTPPASGNSTPVAYGPAQPSMPHIPNIKQPGSALRKKVVNKSEISEPVLISATSNIDTVDLPPGASLKNGMDTSPSLPCTNPRRKGTKKLFGISNKQEPDPSARRYGNPGSPPPVPTGPPRRVVSPEPYAPRSISAQGHYPSPRAMRSVDSFERAAFPPQRPMHPPQRPMIPNDGGMF